MFEDDDDVEEQRAEAPANTLLPAHIRYAGFYIRSAAMVIDTAVLAMPISLILALLMPQIFMDSDRFDSLAGVQPQPGEDMGIFLQSQLVETGFLGQWLLENIIFTGVMAFIVIWFWRKYKATPGKMLLKLEVVDAYTGERPTTKQDILRYLGYIVSSLPLLIGFLWIFTNKRNRGWHDYMGGTVVIYSKSRIAPAVTKETEEDEADDT